MVVRRAWKHHAVSPSGTAACRNTYDEAGRLVKTIDAEGTATTYALAACSHEVVSEGVPPGTAWIYGWDKEPGQAPERA